MHDQSKERAESCETTSGNCKALFDGGPDSHIESVPLLTLAIGQRKRGMKSLTEEIRRIELGKERQARNDSSTGNAAHSKEWNQSNLCPPLQLQVPDQESRQEGESEVGNDAEDTVNETKCDNDSVVDASAIL